MLIKACLNGVRTKADHPAVPHTPAEQATAAAMCVRARAGAIHVHIRGPDGQESLSAGALADLLVELRKACPGVPLGVSTGAWIVPDLELRVRTIAAWRVLPDFASVNFDEPGAVAVARVLIDLGVGVEAGLADASAAAIFLRSKLAEKLVRVLIEPEAQDFSTALETVAEIEAALDDGRVSRPRLLHGMDASAWPLLIEAARRGYDSRIGLEDTLLLPDGRRASDNTELVAAALGVLGAGRR